MSTAGNEKRYMKWYNQMGYGVGAMGTNVMYALPSFFVMIYLTDTVGLDPAVIGTLMMVSKLFDGFTDVICGNLMDRTHSKMGKSRPWMFFGIIGAAFCLFATFAVPESLGKTAQYVWFFIFYTCMNAVFYTAGSIGYNSLTARATRNERERVGMGTWNVVGGYAIQIALGYLGVLMSTAFGWKYTALIFSVLAVVCITITFLSVKEIPEEELNVAGKMTQKESKEKVTFLSSVKLLFSNRFYIMILAIYLLVYVYAGLASVSVYWFTYVLGDANSLGTYSLFIGIPAYVGILLGVPMVKKIGVYKTVFSTEILTAVFFALAIPFGVAGNFIPFLVMSALANLFSSPYNVCVNTMVASASDYTYKKDGTRIDGMMYSCTSVGIKVGSALGTGLTGWLLKIGNYVAGAETQPASSIAVLNFMFLVSPAVIFGLIAALCGFMNIDKANKKLDAVKQEG